MQSNQSLVEVVSTMAGQSDDDMPLVSGMTAEASEVMPEHGSSSDDSESSLWDTIEPTLLDENAALTHAEDYEAEVQRIIGVAAQFEETARTHSYAESTILEFQRVWNRFTTFLRESTIGSACRCKNCHASCSFMQLLRLVEWQLSLYIISGNHVALLPRFSGRQFQPGMSSRLRGVGYVLTS